jgi:hypothetical protein
MKHMRTFEFFNWGKKKKTPKERVDEMHAEINSAWDNLLKEAGGERGLQIGKELGYDNFGDFTDYCYDFITSIKDIIVEDKQNVKYYKSIIVDVNNKMSKVTHIRRVSELSVSKFKSARSKFKHILDLMGSK